MLQSQAKIHIANKNGKDKSVMSFTGPSMIFRFIEDLK